MSAVCQAQPPVPVTAVCARVLCATLLCTSTKTTCTVRSNDKLGQRQARAIDSRNTGSDVQLSDFSVCLQSPDPNIGFTLGALCKIGWAHTGCVMRHDRFTPAAPCVMTGSHWTCHKVQVRFISVSKLHVTPRMAAVKTPRVHSHSFACRHTRARELVRSPCNTHVWFRHLSVFERQSTLYCLEPHVPTTEESDV